MLQAGARTSSSRARPGAAGRLRARRRRPATTRRMRAAGSRLRRLGAVAFAARFPRRDPHRDQARARDRCSRRPRRARALRLWGSDRPPVRLQRRRGRPLRAARDRDVRAHLQPGLLHQPASFTYLLHVAVLRCAGAARDGVGEGAFATDPHGVFAVARAALGAARDGGGRRCFVARARGCSGAAARADRRRLLAHRLPAVHYAHFALNDAPALAPGASRCPARPGSARGRRHARLRHRGGGGSGLACATKYTGGGVVGRRGQVLGAAIAARPRRCCGRSRWPGLIAVLGVPRRQPVLAARPRTRSAPGLFRKQSATASRDGGGKLGVSAPRTRSPTTCCTLTWASAGSRSVAGAGRGPWAAGPARSRRRARARPYAARCCSSSSASRTRFFAPLDAAGLPDAEPARGGPPRWWGAGDMARTAGPRGGPRRRWRPPPRRCSCARRGWSSPVHNDRVLARGGHAPTRAGVDGAPHPGGGEKIVVEPIAPDQWATDVGRLSGARPATGGALDQVPDVALARAATTARSARARASSSSRTTSAPRGRSISTATAVRASAGSWPDPASTGAHWAEPDKVPQAIRYYERAAARGRRGGLPRQPVRAGQQAGCGSPSTSRSTATRSPSSGRARRVRILPPAQVQGSVSAARSRLRRGNVTAPRSETDHASTSRARSSSRSRRARSA